MEKLIIEQGEFTPSVTLDHEAYKFVISGDSRPENASNFYTPILNWLDDFKPLADKSRRFVFEFKFDYFNSTSAKFIMDIFKYLNDLASMGYDVLIKWNFYVEDEDMKETGEEFAQLINVPIELIEYN